MDSLCIERSSFEIHCDKKRIQNERKQNSSSNRNGCEVNGRRLVKTIAAQ
ncbi:hypothetical protein [Bacillus luti]